MALLKIIKLSTKTWKHNGDVDGDFILTKFYAKQEDNEFLLVESYGAKRRKYKINEIEVYDIGGSAETFADFDALFLRLEVLKYPAFYVDGEVPTDFLSNDISTYAPTITPLVGTEKALIHDGTDFKEVAVSEFVGDLQSVTDNGNSTTNTIITPIVKLPKGSFNVEIFPVDLTANRKLEAPNKDGIIATMGDIPLNPITGTGTINIISKFAASGTIGDSQIFDNGTNVGIGTTLTTPPQARLDVRAQGALATDIAFRVRNSTDTQDFLVVNGAGDVYSKGAKGASFNTIFGETAGRNATGISNSLYGAYAGSSIITGTLNCMFGVQAGFLTSSGNRNMMIGVETGRNNTTGSDIVAIGHNALRNNINGGRNIVIGTASNNTDELGNQITVCNNSIHIGYNTRSFANNQTNEIVIGDSAIGLGSNSVVLGNTSITRTRLRGQVIMGAFASAPTGIEGAIYYNSTDKKHYGFNGTTWNALY